MTLETKDYEVHTDYKTFDKAMLDRLVDPDLPPLIYRPDKKIKGVELTPTVLQKPDGMKLFLGELAQADGPRLVPFGFGWAIVNDHHIVKLFRWKWLAKRHLKNVC